MVVGVVGRVREEGRHGRGRGAGEEGSRSRGGRRAGRQRWGVAGTGRQAAAAAAGGRRARVGTPRQIGAERELAAVYFVVIVRVVPGRPVCRRLLAVVARRGRARYRRRVRVCMLLLIGLRARVRRAAAGRLWLLRVRRRGGGGISGRGRSGRPRVGQARVCCRRGRGLRGDVRVPVVREGGVLPASRVCDRVSAVRHGASCVGQVLPRASRRVLLLLLGVSVPARMLMLWIGAIGGGCVVRVPWRQRRLRRGRRRQLAKLGVRRGVRREFLRLLLLRVRVLTRARVLGSVRSTRTRLWARAVLRMRLRLRLRSTEQLVVRLLLPRAGRRGRHRKAAQDKRNGHTRESSSRPPTLASRESAARIRDRVCSRSSTSHAPASTWPLSPQIGSYATDAPSYRARWVGCAETRSGRRTLSSRIGMAPIAASSLGCFSRTVNCYGLALRHLCCGACCQTIAGLLPPVSPPMPVNDQATSIPVARPVVHRSYFKRGRAEDGSAILRKPHASRPAFRRLAP